MENGISTLGQLVGVVSDNFSIKNDVGDTVQLRVKYDFTTSSDQDVKSWLCGNRRIALQRPSRSLSKDELEGLNDTVIMAVDAGKKVKSKAEKVAEAKATLKALKEQFPEEYEVVAIEMGLGV